VQLAEEGKQVYLLEHAALLVGQGVAFAEHFFRLGSIATGHKEPAVKKAWVRYKPEVIAILVRFQGRNPVLDSPLAVVKLGVGVTRAGGLTMMCSWLEVKPKTEVFTGPAQCLRWPCFRPPR
jgi:hypothetical protein